MADDIGNKTAQEYGDAAYRFLNPTTLFPCGGPSLDTPNYNHTGIFAGLRQSDGRLRSMESVNPCVDTTRETDFTEITTNNGEYYGTYTLSNFTLSFTGRKNIVSVAKQLVDAAIPYEWNDALDYKGISFDGTIADINNIRCDGFVEYSYEKNGIRVWWNTTKPSSEWSIVTYPGHHNNAPDLTIDPDYELSPWAQRGAPTSGGPNFNETNPNNTYLTKASIISLPTYQVSQAGGNGFVDVTIRASDTSGIHLIGFWRPEDSGWQYSPRQPQHPTSDSYSYTVRVTTEGYLHYFAQDNGGNYPEYSENVYVSFSTQNEPTVITTSATNITQNSATLNGTITDDGGAIIDERRFEWGVSGSWTNYTSSVQVSGSNFSYNLTGLSPNTTYNYRTWAHNSVGWSMGNTVYFTTQSVSSYPDLIVQSPGVSDSTLTPGQSFTISATVKNQGNGASPLTTLAYYLSTNSTISTSDTFLSVDPVSSLSAGGTSPESNLETAPATTGTYWVGACVTFVVGELNTDNNCSAGVQITVSTAQEVGSIRVSIIPQEAVTAGAQWKLTTESTWLNSGAIKSNLLLGTYTIEFKTILGWVTPPNKSITISVPNPDIWVNSDPYVQQAVADLVVINPSVNDSTLTNGEAFLFSTDVKNQGISTSSATTLRYYKSTDSTISALDTQIATDDVESLSAGAMSPEDQGFFIGESTPAGTFWIGACVDSVSGESNTSNNCSSGVQLTVSNDNTPLNTPSNPSPSNGATGVSITTNLDFSGGSSDSGDTVTYYVYLEANDSSPDNIVCNGITSPHCDPSGNLAYNTTYYWRVMAQDNHGTTKIGPIWSFTTAATYSLSISKSGSGTVTSNPVGINCGSDCSQSYIQGTSITLSASPSNGWRFDRWSGACSGIGQCVINMTANKNVSATFVQVQPQSGNSLANIFHLLLLNKKK